MDFKKKIKLFDIAQNIYLRTIFLALNVGRAKKICGCPLKPK